MNSAQCLKKRFGKLRLKVECFKQSSLRYAVNNLVVETVCVKIAIHISDKTLKL